MSLSNSNTSRLLEQIKNVIDTEVERVTVFDVKAETELLKFHSTELTLGRVLGRGGFCVVNDLDGIELLLGDNDNNNNDHSDDTSVVSRASSLASLACVGRKKLHKNKPTTRTLTIPIDQCCNCTVQTRQTLSRDVGTTRIAKYVVKRVEPKLLTKDCQTYIKGTIDLALEAKFLSTLQHNNIISIRAVSAATPYQELGYFIIVDRMFDILSKRLNTWMQRHRATRGMTGFFTRGKQRSHDLLLERLMVAIDITQAMSYIHSKKIVYRDLKPDNVGFDKNGTVKIFDFGLAKELSDERKTSSNNDLYNMTGLTGGIRYMAPEVGLRKPYNTKVDVYSFSMVLWYILALEPPFGLYTNEMFFDRVYKKKYRPALNIKWSIELRTLLSNCWNHNSTNRPTFNTINSILREHVTSIDPTLLLKDTIVNVSSDSQHTDITM